MKNKVGHDFLLNNKNHSLPSKGTAKTHLDRFCFGPNGSQLGKLGQQPNPLRNAANKSAL